GWAAVANAPWADHLTDLTLGHRASSREERPPGLEAAAALAASPRLKQLRRLWVTSAAIGSDGLATLAASPHLPRLTRFHFDRDRVDDTAGTAVANGFPNLTEIRISNCYLPDAAIADIAKAPLRTRVTKLGLSVNTLTPVAARALAACDGWPKLKDLD